MYKILIITITICACSIAVKSLPPLETVDYVDIDRYVGRWYQIAFFPTRFQKADCGVVVTADYGIDDRGRITVENNCWADYELTESVSSVSGYAVPDNQNNTQLKVRFFWWLPFRANYWIINLDEDDYSYAVVSDPRRRYLWIIARENRMDKELFDELTEDLKNRGFNLDNLAVTAPID